MGLRFNMDAKGLLGDYYGRNTKRLFKTFLILLEDLQTEHIIHFCKLRSNLPNHKGLIEQADYFDEKKIKAHSEPDWFNNNEFSVSDGFKLPSFKTYDSV